MYVVIQMLERKKVNNRGVAKSVEAYSYTNFDGSTAYGYRHSDECFERTNTTAYKVSIRRSYRENGRVKQEQWCLFTASYYDLLEFGLEDFMTSQKVKEIASKAQISIDEFWDMVYMKFTPIIERIRQEYEATEEYKAESKNNREIKEYHERERKFKEEYGECFYNHIYDFYGNLMNEELLEQVKADKRSREEQYKSYENNRSSYQGNSYSNYNSSSYQALSGGNYTEEDKKNLKKIYRVIATKFHPDNAEGSEEIMKLVNKLKQDWNI